MSQSPELAGGEGFTFEGDAAAFYLVSLLAEAYAPGIDDRIVTCVSVQQRDFGEPLDDVIVDFQAIDQDPARLSLQVKRSLVISAAESNSDFREVIRDAWATLEKPSFRVHIDRFGAAVGTITPSKERALKTLCDWARESMDADHFQARFNKEGSASNDMTVVKDDVVALLAEAKGAPCSGTEIHLFLAHFVLIQFDFLREGATDAPDAINRIRNCLAADEAAKAPLVWSRIVQLARASAGKSGRFDRARLARFVGTTARLQGAISYQRDIDRVTALARSQCNLIPDDIGGTRLARLPLFAELDAKLRSSRVVQVRGMPGSGKSVVIKRMVQRALERGPVLFLKAEQLEGANWFSYAQSSGLRGTDLASFMVEIGAAGTPILFIDAIDRVTRDHQPIILDVLGAIADTPLLDNWKIVVSLRDTGIELLRSWLGDFLDVLTVDTLSIDQITPEEALALAESAPHLEPLLFGAEEVRRIVRRPFFAKVLHQSCLADPSRPAFAPQSEVDLIENWWRRGGYNESGQNALERQRALINIARARARRLNQPVSLGELPSVAHIENLRADGILQHAREGISVRFAHDIFFEWAFFYALADRGAEWMEEVKSCGEPPALARVVELLSQWEYRQAQDWHTHLARIERSEVRSQWTRAWLAGPFGSAALQDNAQLLAETVFADDYHLFRKLLVWFQAEKTAPNTGILESTLSQEERQQFSDLLGGPSDFGAWYRLISFILQRVDDIPPRLYPEIIVIFDVWQNAMARTRNPVSHAILKQCEQWLAAIKWINNSAGPVGHDRSWGDVEDLRSLEKSLRHIVLRSSIGEPSFAMAYLQTVIEQEDIPEALFRDIISYSPLLVRGTPQLAVDLSLTFLRDEVPDERVAREKERLQLAVARRKAIEAKPAAERTRQENMALCSAHSLHAFGNFGYHDWEKLSIQDEGQTYWPASPLREPFHSLFQSDPGQALRLLSALCNHAMKAWRQLHCHASERRGTPLPLALSFPWGEQEFWGTDREYQWFRGTPSAPHVIACGFLALEDWCFAELSRGRTADELIEAIVKENQCIAILGSAAMLALSSETVSDVTLPLIVSQRLLMADQQRYAEDLSPVASLVGFNPRSDKAHVAAVRAINARPIRKTPLSRMVPHFVFAPGALGIRARETLIGFKDKLPFVYAEHRDRPEIRERLTRDALGFEELADAANYRAYRARQESDEVAIVHVSPSVADPANQARAEEASRYLLHSALWQWAAASFDADEIEHRFTIRHAVALARDADSADLFAHPGSDEVDALPILRAAVMATAAMALYFRAECRPDDLAWARNVLSRAILMAEVPDRFQVPGSIIPWHTGIYVARALAAELREGTGSENTAHDFLDLISHPLEIVSLTALEEACGLWSIAPGVVWTALSEALSLCHVQVRSTDDLDEQQPERHRASRAPGEMIEQAEALATTPQDGHQWSPLPSPPPAWTKVEPGSHTLDYRVMVDWDDDSADLLTLWREPDISWHSKNAAEIVKRIPFDEILKSSAKDALLDFLDNALQWTNEKNAPPPLIHGHGNRPPRMSKWTHALGSTLGCVAGLLPLSDMRSRLVDPILALDDDDCWALLAPFANTYICRYMYDAPTVPADAVATLDLCLGRLLQDAIFVPDAYRAGRLSGFHQPELVRALMFVSVEKASAAARYVNGDWREIGRILPLIDRFIRAAGWAGAIMSPYLTLCERAKADYPAEMFVDQILSIVTERVDQLVDWHGTMIPARIAGLVQHFAHRAPRISSSLAQKFLRILDVLVDMGDRRSAALQLGEVFRDVQRTS